MNLNKYKIRPCFGCLIADPNSDDYEMMKCKTREHLPRKKKKKLKKWVILMRQFGYQTHWFVEEISSCNIHSDYKRLNKSKDKFQYLLKYKREIIFLMQIGEDITLDNNFKIGYFWEHDSDYGGSSGVEPLQFEQQGEMWMFESLQYTLKEIGLNITDYKNELELLKGLRRYLNKRDHVKQAN